MQRLTDPGFCFDAADDDDGGILKYPFAPLSHNERFAHDIKPLHKKQS
jgi:hypothetical protein